MLKPGIRLHPESNYIASAMLCSVSRTLVPRVVRTAMQTTAMRNRISAYSTSACPSSRRDACLRTREHAKKRVVEHVNALLGGSPRLPVAAHRHTPHPSGTPAADGTRHGREIAAHLADE